MPRVPQFTRVNVWLTPEQFEYLSQLTAQGEPLSSYVRRLVQEDMELSRRRRSHVGQ